MQLLDLMLEFFADDGRWTQRRYGDGNGSHCLVGALLHLGRKHRLPVAPAIALLQDAMPCPGLPLVHFNDTRCGSGAELRSVILNARRLAHGDAQQERAAAAVAVVLIITPKFDAITYCISVTFSGALLKSAKRLRSPAARRKSWRLAMTTTPDPRGRPQSVARRSHELRQHGLILDKGLKRAATSAGRSSRDNCCASRHTAFRMW